jgi:hypothetical protein
LMQNSPLAPFLPGTCDRPCPFQQPMDGASIAKIRTMSNSLGSYKVVLLGGLL